MEVIIKGEAKEIADLVLEAQGRQENNLKRKMSKSGNEREQLIRRYESDIRQLEKRLERLKRGESPLHVVI